MRRAKVAAEGWLLSMRGFYTGGGMCTLPESAVYWTLKCCMQEYPSGGLN